MRARQPRPAQLVRVLVRTIVSRTAAAVVVGAFLAVVFRKLHELWLQRRHQKAEGLWRRHVDFSVVQACIMTTEHLESLGRVEKRTLFVKPITEVFRNDYILSRLLEVAEKAASSADPVMTTQLSAEDKWHILNACTNHISSCFAPYHIFFNEARRVKSYYQSAWYCFTLTCAQTAASGRWFITPFKPVGVDDVGMLRIRIVLMNEQELRDIAAGTIEPPAFGFFNGRHESRWKVCQRMAELLARQLHHVAGSTEPSAEWGPNLCGRLSKPSSLRHKKVASQQRLTDMVAGQPAQAYDPEDNALLRIHIPFPAMKASFGTADGGSENPEDNVSRDVVLFE